MKRKISATAAVLGALMAVTACAGGKTPQDNIGGSTPDVKYDYVYETMLRTDRGYEVSPFIYGEFLEHIQGCIYGVIWSELLEDRKFWYEAGKADFSPWTVSGDVASDAECYSENGHAAVLATGASISQTVDFAAGDYTGYFYASGEGILEISVGDFVKSIPVSGSFTKYEYTMSQDAGKKTVSFKCKEGSFKLDSLSLMPADNYHGMRRDTLEAMKELAGTIYRWPGGNFVSGYFWKDGVGDIDKRPSRRNPAWFPDRGEEADKTRLKNRYNFYDLIDSNDMGTDEFLYMCEYIGAVPYIAVNTGTGTVEDAADLVEYCNGAVSTEYGAKRAANGREKPWALTYWCVGNEMQGDWQIGHTALENYVVMHNDFVKAMRAVDANIFVTGCGDNVTNWTEGMFAGCANSLDYIAEHLYEPSSKENSVAIHMLMLKNNLQARITAHRDLIKRYPAAKNVKIAFDEYNYKWATKATVRDALGISAALNLFISNADVVGMANYSDTVFTSSRNAPGGLYVGRDEVTFSAVGDVLRAYAKYMQPYATQMTIRQTDKDTRLDAQATVSADGKTVAFAVANPSDKRILLNMRSAGKATTLVTVMGADAWDMTAERTVTENPDHILLEPLSVSVVVYQIG